MVRWRIGEISRERKLWSLISARLWDGSKVVGYARFEWIEGGRRNGTE